MISPIVSTEALLAFLTLQHFWHFGKMIAFLASIVVAQHERSLTSCIKIYWTVLKLMAQRLTVYLAQVDLASGREIDTDLSGTVCPSQEAVQRTYPTAVDNEGWIWYTLS